MSKIVTKFKKFTNRLDFLGVVLSIIFVAFLVYFLKRGDSILGAILISAFETICILVFFVLMWLLIWRLFTKEGREAEKVAQARYEIKKLERKRDREWKRMNR